MSRCVATRRKSSGSAGGGSTRSTGGSARQRPTRRSVRARRWSFANWRPAAIRRSDRCRRLRGRTRARSLAFAITVEGGVGNGVQLYDTATGTLRGLDSSASTYSGLAWRKESASLAVLRSQANDAREGPTHVLLAWQDATRTAAAARELDAAKSGLAGDFRVVRFRAPRWSEDGAHRLCRRRAVADEAGAFDKRRLTACHCHQRQRRRASRRPGVAPERHHRDGEAEARRAPRSRRTRCWPPGGSTRPPRPPRRITRAGGDAHPTAAPSARRRYRRVRHGPQHRPRRRQRLDRRREERHAL